MMRPCRLPWSWLRVLLLTVWLGSGCTYAAMQKLSPEERSEFHTYRKVMTAAQERAYLAKSSTTERTAYLSEIGLVQRFQALDPLDRDATIVSGTILAWGHESPIYDRLVRDAYRRLPLLQER
ncbi:MAG: hypothetical protein FJZ47_00810, partial [Candidatus Tectomicrobia bacterium]|nr:hypothetical protein [Candidatus Tectomicrobia bacterium]